MLIKGIHTRMSFHFPHTTYPIQTLKTTYAPIPYMTDLIHQAFSTNFTALVTATMPGLQLLRRFCKGTLENFPKFLNMLLKNLFFRKSSSSKSQTNL